MCFLRSVIQEIQSKNQSFKFKFISNTEMPPFRVVLGPSEWSNCILYFVRGNRNDQPLLACSITAAVILLCRARNRGRSSFNSTSVGDGDGTSAKIRDENRKQVCSVPVKEGKKVGRAPSMLRDSKYVVQFRTRYSYLPLCAGVEKRFSALSRPPSLASKRSGKVQSRKNRLRWLINPRAAIEFVFHWGVARFT